VFREDYGELVGKMNEDYVDMNTAAQDIENKILNLISQRNTKGESYYCIKPKYQQSRVKIFNVEANCLSTSKNTTLKVCLDEECLLTSKADDELYGIKYISDPKSLPLYLTTENIEFKIYETDSQASVAPIEIGHVEIPFEEVIDAMLFQKNTMCGNILLLPISKLAQD